MSADAEDSDYIDSNHIWQRRLHAVLKDEDSSAMFPYATAIGLEFNPAFERITKIPADLVTNGAILDLHDFLKAIEKSACQHLSDILLFNFDIGLSPDHPESYNFAYKIYSSAKLFLCQLRGRSKLQERLQDAFVLPEVESVEDFDSEPSEQMQFYDERKGEPVFITKGCGYVYKLRMNVYPQCKRLGVSFDLRPSNAPPQKVNPSLLTMGMVLEMLEFVEFLSGRYTVMLKELTLHNFGEVFEPCYLTGQVKALYDKKVSTPASDRMAFFDQPFKFMIKKNVLKRAADLESDGDEIPEKLASTKQSDEENAGEEEDPESYMCPVDFEADLAGYLEAKTEAEEVDVETFIEDKSTPEVSISKIFSEDTLPMSEKTVKQKEWALRANRITELLRKGMQSSFMFARSRKIGLDFNVASGQKRNLNSKLLTNHTLFELHKFCSHLSRSMTSYLLYLAENSFSVETTDNFHSYLYSKEKCLQSQVYSEVFLNTPIHFPEIYTADEIAAKSPNQEVSDISQDEDLSDDFPYCKKIGVNLWTVKSPERKQRLSSMTHGALLEIFTLARKLCNKPEELLRDILMHNFDVDLQDSTTEDAKGLHQWFSINRFMIKKPFCLIKTNIWLIEVVNLKDCAPKIKQQSDVEMPTPLPAPKVCSYEICKKIGLDLNLSCKSASKQKLDLKALTRGVLFEVHHYVKSKCNRYVPALYEILDYNFDLSSQSHRRVEFAWSIAAQVLAMVRKGHRGGDYMTQTFELPFEGEEGGMVKEEEEERQIEATTKEEGDDDVVFVQKFVPVDMDVEIE